MKIKKKHKITTLEKEDISKRMRQDKLYYHCCGCGGIWEDKNKLIKILELKDLWGLSSIPREFNDYHLTSGFCDDCYKNKNEN